MANIESLLLKEIGFVKEDLYMEKKPSYFVKLMKAIAIALVFGLVSGVSFAGVNYATDKYLRRNEPVASIEQSQSNSGTEASQDAKDAVASSIEATAVSTATTVSDVSDIVENVMPSVVAVTNLSMVDYMSWFGQRYQYESTSCGSGFIIAQDNDNIYIATNNHVVNGAETLTITFCDDEAVEGAIKGADPSVDLAVVAVPVSDIKPETLSVIKTASVSSDELVVGQSAVVIGNALGYGQSVTTGVVSALSREVSLRDDSGNVITNSLIQTDAAINPGNSGGALLDMSGRVIGIVSAKYSNTSVEGVGYAIPISTAEEIINQMISNEVVSEENASYLGIAGYDISKTMSKQHNVPMGVYITQVVDGSAADSAGIVSGDIIVSLNGRTVNSMSSIQNILKYLPAGTEVEITVCKSNKDYEEETYTITLTRKIHNS